MSHTYEKALHLGLSAILASLIVASGAVSCSDGSEADEGAGGSTANTGGSTANAGGSSANAGGTTGNAGGTTGNAGGTSGNAGGTTGSGGSGGATALPDGVCANGIDDDGDGLIDGFDPECTGAADNDEGTFATGIPGDNRDPVWQDCFFDGNSGAGEDGCRYHTDCLYGDLPADDPDCVLSQECVELAINRFGEVRVDKIIFTKVDEAAHLGVVLNVVRKVNKSLSYITTGQDVPDDIEVSKGKRLAQLILGKNS